MAKDNLDKEIRDTIQKYVRGDNEKTSVRQHLSRVIKEDAEKMTDNYKKRFSKRAQDRKRSFDKAS